MDIGAIMKIKKAWDNFQVNHPSFPAFLQDVKATGIPVDSDITISITYPDGTKKRAGLHVKDSDTELLHILINFQ